MESFLIVSLSRLTRLCTGSGGQTAGDAGGPPELPVQEFSCGETVYDRQARLLRRPAQAVCQAYLHAITRPGGLFVDFELRGEVKV